MRQRLAIARPRATEEFRLAPGNPVQWTAFRDADCAAYEDDDWGTISKIDASQCVLRRTVERTIELEAFPADHGPG